MYTIASGGCIILLSGGRKRKLFAVVIEHSKIGEHLEMALWGTVAQKSSSPYSIVGEQ
jgi:hypothetical protein